MGPGQGMMATFSVCGPNILFYMENIGRDWFLLGIMIFYYGDRAGELCLSVVQYLTIVGPGQGKMANFSGKLCLILYLQCVHLKLGKTLNGCS